MNDMTPAIQPKSDQLNADDMMAGPITVTIREVRITPGSEQPVSIVLDGTDKFFRPCKSMSRVLVQAWGADAKAYIGRSLTLYRDPTVKWGGMEVGGIRISHMSHIDGAKQMMLTATKGSRKPHKVLPLVMQVPAAKADGATNWANGYIAKLETFTTADALAAFATEKAAKLAELATARPELHEKVTEALATRTADLKGGSSFDDEGEFTEADDEPSEPAGSSMADQLADRPGETDTFGLEPADANVGFSDQLGGEENRQTAEKSVAEQAVEKVIAMAQAATTSEALEKIIAEAEGHKAAMGPDLATKLEIALDQERQRFVPVTEGAK